jgi:hypothetical protein
MSVPPDPEYNPEPKLVDPIFTKYVTLVEAVLADAGICSLCIDLILDSHCSADSVAVFSNSASELPVL